MPERGNHFLAMRITIYSGRQIKGSGFLDDIMELLHKTWTVCIRTSFYMRKINSYLVKSSRMSFYYMQPSTNPNEYKLQTDKVFIWASFPGFISALGIIAFTAPVCPPKAAGLPFGGRWRWQPSPSLCSFFGFLRFSGSQCLH